MPFYVAAQVAGSTLASGTVRLVFDVDKDKYFGTVPAGSDIQSFAIEIIIAFLQMFVVCGVATDTRAVCYLVTKPSKYLILIISIHLLT